MSTIDRFEFVESSASLYEHHAADSWKDDHAIAMVCFGFAELVYEGVNLYDSICRLDNDWRIYVYREEVSYDTAVERRIEGLFAKWVTTSEGVLRIHDQSLNDEYANRGFDVEVVEKLRSLCIEVRSSMVSDQEFFAKDKTFEIADSAVNEHNTGATEAMDILNGLTAL